MRLIFLLSFIILSAPQAISAERYLVFAAASMKDALEEIAKKFENDTGNKLVLSLAGHSKTGPSDRQWCPGRTFSYQPIMNGWTGWLKGSVLLALGKKTIAGNRLVIVGAH